MSPTAAQIQQQLRELRSDYLPLNATTRRVAAAGCMTDLPSWRIRWTSRNGDCGFDAGAYLAKQQMESFVQLHVGSPPRRMTRESYECRKAVVRHLHEKWDDYSDLFALDSRYENEMRKADLPVPAQDGYCHTMLTRYEWQSQATVSEIAAIAALNGVNVLLISPDDGRDWLRHEVNPADPFAIFLYNGSHYVLAAYMDKSQIDALDTPLPCFLFPSSMINHVGHVLRLHLCDLYQSEQVSSRSRGSSATASAYPLQDSASDEESSPLLVDEFIARVLNGPDGEHAKLMKELLERRSTELSIVQQMLDKGKLPTKKDADLCSRNAACLLFQALIHEQDGRPCKVQAVGEVQSGKTASMSFVIAKAVDRGYRGVVVVSGHNVVLRQQSQQRFDELFPTTSSRFVWATNYNDVTGTVAPNAKSAHHVTRLPYLHHGKLSAEMERKGRVAGQPSVFLACIKKHAKAMERFLTRLRNEIPPEYKMLFIDDESDDKTVQTARSPAIAKHLIHMIKCIDKPQEMEQAADAALKDEEVYAEQEEEKPELYTQDQEEEEKHLSTSASAAASPSLPASVPNRNITLVRYTATPQANILEGRDSPLFPDAVWLIEQRRDSATYMGINSFFGNVPFDLLFPPATLALDYNHIEEAFDEHTMTRLALTPLQTIPYADFHNQAPFTYLPPSGNPRRGRRRNVYLPDLPDGIVFKDINARQRAILQHITREENRKLSAALADIIPNRIPPSVYQALADYLLGGAVKKFRIAPQRQQLEMQAPSAQQLQQAAASAVNDSGSASTQLYQAAQAAGFETFDSIFDLAYHLHCQTRPGDRPTDSRRLLTKVLRTVAARAKELPVDEVRDIPELQAALSSEASDSCNLVLGHLVEWGEPDQQAAEIDGVLGTRVALDCAGVQVSFLVWVRGKDDGRWQLVKCADALGAVHNANAPHFYVVLTADAAGRERFLVARYQQFHRRGNTFALFEQPLATALKDWHAALFHVSERQNIHALYVKLLDEAFAHLTSVLPRWLRGKLGVGDGGTTEQQFIELQGNETPLTVEVRLRILFPATFARVAELEQIPATERNKKQLDELQKLQAGLAKQRQSRLDWQRELAEDEAKNPEHNETNTILQILDQQWKRLRLRMKQAHEDPHSDILATQPIPSLPSMVYWLFHIANRTAVRKCNDKKQDVDLLEQRLIEFDYEPYPDPFGREVPDPNVPRNVILVGGNVFNRGLTINGLMVTYLARSVYQADLAMQLLRCCGHKVRERDLVTLYVQQRAAELYAELNEHDRRLRLFFREFILAGKDVRVHPIVLLQRMQGQAAAATFEVAAQLRRRNGVFVKPQKVADFCDPVVHAPWAQHNMEHTNEFIRQLQQSVTSPASSTNLLGEKLRKCFVYMDVRQETVLAFLRGLYASCADEEASMSGICQEMAFRLSTEAFKYNGIRVQINVAVMEREAATPVLSVRDCKWSFPTTSWHTYASGEEGKLTAPELYDCEVERDAARGRDEVVGRARSWLTFAPTEEDNGGWDYSEPLDTFLRRQSAPLLIILYRYQSTGSARNKLAAQTGEQYVPCLQFVQPLFGADTIIQPSNTAMEHLEWDETMAGPSQKKPSLSADDVRERLVGPTRMLRDFYEAGAFSRASLLLGYTNTTDSDPDNAQKRLKSRLKLWPYKQHYVQRQAIPITRIMRVMMLGVLEELMAMPKLYDECQQKHPFLDPHLPPGRLRDGAGLGRAHRGVLRNELRAVRGLPCLAVPHVLVAAAQRVHGHAAAGGGHANAVLYPPPHLPRPAVAEGAGAQQLRADAQHVLQDLRQLSRSRCSHARQCRSRRRSRRRKGCSAAHAIWQVQEGKEGGHHLTGRPGRRGDEERSGSSAAPSSEQLEEEEGDCIGFGGI